MKEKRLYVKRTGDFQYPIVLKHDFSKLSEEVQALKSRPGKICIVTDSHVAPLYMEEVKKALAHCAETITSYTIPAGEEHKNLEEIQGLYEHLIQEHFDRKDMLAALGGGVIGDMTGFTAATYLRGIDFIQIPTTLLSQVDSSIGGKTGVDLKQYKNMVGAFYQPLLVYMNTEVLKTLSDIEFSSGMGEVLKHGFLKDAAYSQWITEHTEPILSREAESCRQMIYQSCVIKKTIVEQDPTEQGERALLNLGHTIGHAVEKLKNFTLAHGHCVALGCAAAGFLSCQRGLLTKEELEALEKQLLDFHLPIKTQGLSAAEVLKATKSDKKMQGKQIKFVLIQKPGHAVLDTTVTDEELLSAINYILEDSNEDN